MISEARLQANRANALKSTGPRSEEGKAVSRLNSTTHGLTATTVALASYDPDLVMQRLAAWNEIRRPVTSHERWLVEQMALATIRIDQSRLEEDCLRTQTSQRAATCWDEDRQVDAEELAGKLARNPSLIVAKLRGTLHGSIWLRDRWESLEEVAMEYREKFFELGGEEFSMVPALNDDDRHAEVLTSIIERQLGGWQ